MAKKDKKLDISETPSTVNPRRRLAPSGSKPGVENVLFPYATGGRELVIRDSFAESSHGFGLEEGDDTWGEREEDLITEDDYREFFDLQSEDEEDDDWGEGDVTEYAEEAYDDGIDADPEWTMVAKADEAIDAITPSTRAALEAERSERALDQAVSTRGSNAVNNGMASYPMCWGLNEHETRNDKGWKGQTKAAAQYKRHAKSQLGRSTASAKAAWLNANELDIVEIDAIAARLAEIEAAKAEMNAWVAELEGQPLPSEVIVRDDDPMSDYCDDEYFYASDDHHWDDEYFNDYVDAWTRERLDAYAAASDEPSDADLEREEELDFVQRQAWIALEAATAWTGRVDVDRYRKEAMELVELVWAWISPSEVQQIVDQTLRNAFEKRFLDDLAFEQHDEIGGKKPWWWGRQGNLSDLTYSREDRGEYRRGNKPVKFVRAKVKLDHGEDAEVQPKLRVPETGLRKERRERLAMMELVA